MSPVNTFLRYATTLHISRLGRHGVFLVIQAIHTAEIGDTRLGGHARAAEKDDVVAVLYHLAELVDLVHTRPPFWVVFEVHCTKGSPV